MHTEIEVTTLGHLQIQQNGQIVEDFISTKAVLLFAYLAMHPGEHTRKKLAMMFWSETNDQQALKNLRTVLSSLRHTLPDALIVLRDVLAINPDVAIRVDAHEFESGCIAAFSSPDMLDLLKHMQGLADLYQGVFLADVPFREAVALEVWITDKQRQLQQLYARLLYEIIELAQKQGHYEIGIAHARQLVNLDPYWDAARCQLMRLLAYTNHSNEALREYEAFARLLAEELDAVPDEQTTVLYEQIRSRHIRLPQQRADQSSIVLPDMPFVETIEDIAIAQRMLNTPQCRLLTIYGISGIGKTALATQIAFHRQHLYQDGAYLISLKHAQSARDLPYMIANTLCIDFISQTPPSELEQIVLEHLKDHHTLLVLDNYENLLPETGFVQKMLEQATRTQLVITSQAPLNLFREWLLPLQGLRVPLHDDHNPEKCESVRLFELTAQRINPRFNLHENLGEVIEICQLVDGLPLALIIAAGWTQIVSIHKIKEYIVEGQEFSLPLHQDLPLHHQSLEMMLDYTWNTLGDQEQYALTALSIFNASFGIEEVQRICDIDIDILMALIQKSLIQKYDDKYRMHQLIWRYARKKLLYSDKKEGLGQRYMHTTIEILSDLQNQKLPLHEYLVVMETHYARIWNYQWMPKSFQPIYILTLSRFLIAYWEISRIDELPVIRSLFENMPRRELYAESRLLLYLQLTRFYLHDDQFEQAYQGLRSIFRDNALSASWADWGVVFSLSIPLFRMMDIDHTHESDIDEDTAILNDSYIKLLLLYLDMRDYEAADGLFIHLLESTQHPLDHVLTLAIQGTIAATIQQFSTAYTHFTGALKHLQSVNEPLLKLSISSLTARIAHLLKRDKEAREHLHIALMLAAELDTAPAMLQLLNFSAELPYITRHDAFTDYVQETIHALEDLSGKGTLILQDTLYQISERIIAHSVN